MAPALGFEAAFLTVGVLMMAFSVVLWWVLENRANDLPGTETVFVTPGRGD